MERIEEAIKREASSIIHDRLKDPRLGFITVTQVRVSPDLRLAQISYSVLGKEEDYQKSRQAMESATGFVRKLIAERLQLRFAPEIIFREDRSQEYSIRIQEILEEIKELEISREQAKRKPKKSSRLDKKK